LYGVGALDMKSSLAAYIYAAKALLRFSGKLSGKIIFQFVIDEEPIAASFFGTFNLLEKGFVGDAAIIGEPGTHKITIGNRGGYRFKLEIFGEATHTGSREWEQKKKGKNAILIMIRAVKALSEIKFLDTEYPAFPGRKTVFTFPTEISGGKAINIVLDSCVAFGDVRLLPGITQEFIESRIKEKLESLDINYKLTPIIYVPAVAVDKNEPLVQILQQNAKEILNKELILEGSGPWSDMWMFAEKGIPAVNFGCEGKGLHARDEYVEIDSVIEVTKIYALTALDFLQ
jgi:succinyl-diaminopimelate desuccinylase